MFLGHIFTKRRNIPFLISNASGCNPPSNQCNNESQPLGTYDTEFPSLGSNRSTKSTAKRKLSSESEGGECTLSLKELKDIPAKQKSKEEAKRYRKLLYEKRKESMTNEEKTREIQRM